MANWDVRFMHLAEFVANWSKDRSAKIGCVIVGPDHEVRSLGYNGFPRGCNDNRDDRHERPAKYKYTEHGERNAVFNAARCGVSLKGCTAYIPWYPCADCARSLIQSGVSTIVAVEPNWNDERWGADFRVVKDMLDECKVRVRWFPESQLRNGPVYTVREADVLAEAFETIRDFLGDIPLPELEDEGLIEDPNFKHLVERVRILSHYVPAISRGLPDIYKLVMALYPVNRKQAMDAVDQVSQESRENGH
jgi:dCMP deaminase